MDNIYGILFVIIYSISICTIIVSNTPFLMKYIKDLMDWIKSLNFIQPIMEMMDSLFAKTPAAPMWKDILKERTNISLDTDSPDIQKYSTQLVFMLAFTIISSLIVYFASTDTNALTSKFYFYIFLILAPCIIGIYVGKEFFKTESFTNINLYKYIPYIIAGLLLIVGIYSIPTTATNLLLFNYLTNILLFLIIIVGLAIFYYIFVNYLKKQTGLLGFMIHFIFYIPCLLSDLLQYIKDELAITPNIVFLLFIIEIIFILMYFYIIPRLFKLLVQWNSSSTVLLNSPLVLNKPEMIADMQNPIFILDETIVPDTNQIGNQSFLLNKLKKIFSYNKSDTRSLQKSYRNNNYAVSFWVYVNPGSAASDGYQTESNIFNYAEGKPRITYVNNGTDSKNKFVIYFSNNTAFHPSSYEIDGVNQRWMYFVINYYENSADLFINGILERTIQFNNNNIPHKGVNTDNITVGDKNGLNGAICNVNYYTSPMTIYTISNIYNILKYQNPPILKLNK